MKERNEEVIATGRSKGNRLNQSNYPLDGLIDKETSNVLIADYGSRRIV